MKIMNLRLFIINKSKEMNTISHLSIIRTLTLDLSLHPGEISNFRSCIVKIVGREEEIFHNHDNAKKSLKYSHWGYPLVQYAVRGGRATLVGIDAGANAINQILLPKLLGQLQFSGRNHWLSGLQVNEKRHEWQIQATPLQYGLSGWLALNGANYRDWKATNNDTERFLILNKALTGQLRSIAQAAGIPNVKLVKGEVLQVDNQKRVYWRKIPFVRFHALITSNLSLPTGIGIGRNVAFGYGEILPVSVYQRLLSKQPLSESYYS